MLTSKYAFAHWLEQKGSTYRSGGTPGRGIVSIGLRQRAQVPSLRIRGSVFATTRILVRSFSWNVVLVRCWTDKRGFKQPKFLTLLLFEQLQSATSTPYGCSCRSKVVVGQVRDRATRDVDPTLAT